MKNQISYFIAQRLKNHNGSQFSVAVYRIAVGSVALGLAAMLLSFMIFEGFRQQIQEKIFTFSGHIQVGRYDGSNAYESSPIAKQRKVVEKIRQLPQVEYLQMFSQKAALLKKDTEVMGVMLKGVEQDFDTLRFNQNLQEGRFLHFPDSLHSADLIVSQYIARKLDLHLHDSLVVVFIQEPPRFRKMHICGIYNTGIEDFDHQLVLADLRLLQKVNNWADSLTAGYEIRLKDFELLQKPFLEDFLDVLDYDMWVETALTKYTHFFDWFVMLSRNVMVFLVVILFVACFNSVSILLILIMERTQMIGILKALGASNRLIKRTFFFHGLQIVGRGMAWGNGLALLLGGLQSKFKIIPLTPENYYMDTVPVAWELSNFIFCNLLIFTLIALSLLIPIYIISRITPMSAIRFD